MKDETVYTEKELFLLIADGDEAAFRQLFHLYVPLIRSITLKITKNEGAAPDLVQEVFLRIWLYRDRLPDINNPRPWIIKIAYHQCFNWLRQKKVRDNANLQLAAAGKQEYGNSTEEINLFRETSLILRQAIEQLPPQTKRIYLLSRDEGLKINEIAAMLKLSPPTVKNTLSRSLKVIRDSLEKQGIFLPFFLLCYWLH